VRVEIRNDHVVDVIRCELDDDEQHRIAAALAEQGIRVEPVIDIYHVLHLWALAPCSTAQEVRALTAFHDATDCRLAWHEAVA
jgi:hypothetical protein